jgi:hypothetical protein
MSALNLADLELLLRLAAAGQLLIAILGPTLPRVLGWREAIARMPLLVREVFWIHTIFIALTCAIFGVLTWRFAGDLARTPQEFLRWLAGGIGLFWGTRSIMQWSHYSASHWRGLVIPTVVHWALFLGYGAFAATYFIAAFR